MAQFLSYEETVPLLRRSYFPDFTIHTRDFLVSALISLLADDPYAETLDPGIQKQTKTGRPMTPKEMKSLNKHAQILIMNDERKATAIAHFVKATLNKDLKPIPNNEPNDCGYSAVLQQISNLEYTYNKETGDDFTAGSQVTVQLSATHSLG